MTIVTHFSGQNLRNLAPFAVECSETLNFFHGPNGSGKTSLLEALYLLAHARSFRTHQSEHFIHYSAEQTALFARLRLPQQPLVSVGLEKSKQKAPQKIKIDGVPVKSSIELVQLLPMQLIGPESFDLLQAGPSVRRQFLDWGLFHVEPSFFPAWKMARRCLAQRNAALRAQRPRAEVTAWDGDLIEAANVLDQFRSHYIQAITPFFLDMCGVLLETFGLELHYCAGWVADKPYAEVLQARFHQDCQRGTTGAGPHRADIKIKTNSGLLAEDVLSRGQQKLLVCALFLAQGVSLKQVTQTACVYLLDDIFAELDESHSRRVLDIIMNLESQVFLTAVSPLSFFSKEPTKLPLNAKSFSILEGNIK